MFFSEYLVFSAVFGSELSESVVSDSVLSSSQSNHLTFSFDSFAFTAELIEVARLSADVTFVFASFTGFDVLFGPPWFAAPKASSLLRLLLLLLFVNFAYWLFFNLHLLIGSRILRSFSDSRSASTEAFMKFSMFE